MTLISYAQNFEDVMLWRALRHVSHGFYIDVGAMHPELHSVTRAFYEQGWHGVNIEPISEHFNTVAAARPRDINLQTALGATVTECNLFVVPDTGLSTLNAEVAAQHRDSGRPVTEIRAPVTTLAEVCRRYAPAEIHFIKIDVEGAEEHVLAGADFQTFRPWIVLVEATRPLTAEENYDLWEPILLAANYRFVWFDGLNRFYLADERYEELRRHFSTPPNVFDDFIRIAEIELGQKWQGAEGRAAEALQQLAASEARTTEALQRLAASEARIAEALQQSTAAEAHVADALQRLAASEAHAAGTLQRLAASEAYASNVLQRLAAAEAQAAKIETQLTAAEARAATAEARVELLRKSFSWRITSPFRWARLYLAARSRRRL